MPELRVTALIEGWAVGLWRGKARWVE